MAISSPLLYAIVVTCVLLVWVIMYIILQRMAMQQIQELAAAAAAKRQATTTTPPPVQVHIMAPSIAPPTQPALSKEGSFQQIGTLLSGDGANRKVLPLYAASINRGRKWNYFTQTDGYQSIKLSVKAKNKDCLDEWGCDELEDGDEVVVEELGATMKVKKYNRSSYIYNSQVI